MMYEKIQKSLFPWFLSPYPKGFLVNSIILDPMLARKRPMTIMKCDLTSSIIFISSPSLSRRSHLRSKISHLVSCLSIRSLRLSYLFSSFCVGAIHESEILLHNGNYFRFLCRIAYGLIWELSQPLFFYELRSILSPIFFQYRTLC